MRGLPEILEALPQAHLLSQEARDRWIRTILAWQPERALWHAERLSGIGGSEIGPIVRHLLGLPDGGFSSMTRVVEQKLLQRMPEAETHHMRRGTVLEDLARRAFRYKYSFEPDDRALAAMREHHAREGLEWLRGNPDDLGFLNGKRWLVDYKVPENFDIEVSFDYQAQLHHYELGARLRGIKCDGGLILAKLDLAPQIARSVQAKIEAGTMTSQELDDFAYTIARTNVEGMRIMGIMVESKMSLHRDILDCGAEAWHSFVLQGVVPEADPRAPLVLDEATSEELAHLQKQYVLAKSGIARLDAISAAASQGIIDRLAGHDLSQYKPDTPLVAIREKKDVDGKAVIAEAIARGALPEDIQPQKKVFNVEALVEEIRRLGGNPEDPSLLESSAPAAPSAQLAEAFLQARNVDLSPFERRSLSVVLSTKKEAKQLRGLLEEQASEVFFGWVDSMSADEPATAAPELESTARGQTAGSAYDEPDSPSDASPVPSRLRMSR